MPYLARSLGYEEYGSYGQVFLIGAIFTVIFSLGTLQVLNVLYAENENREERVFSSNFWLFVVSGLAAVVLIAVFREYLGLLMSNPELGNLLLSYSPAVFFGMLGSAFATTIVYFGRAKELAVAAVVTNVIRVAMLVVAITVLQSLLLAILALSLSTAIQAVWYLLLVPKQVRKFGIVDRALLKEQLKLSYPMLLVSLFGTGVVNADGVIVSNLLGVKEFAVYRAGAIEIPFIGSMYGTVATVLMPDLARLAVKDKGAEIFQLNRRASSVTAIAVFPITIFLIAFGEELITLYLSEKYAESGIVFSIYSCAVLIRITMYQGIPLAYKRSKAILIAFALGLGLTVGLNFLLVPAFGAKGAAASYVASQFFLAAYLTVLSSRLTHQPLRGYFDWLFLVTMGGLCVVAAASISYLHSAYPGYALLGLLTSVYFGIVLLFVWRVRPEHLEVLSRLVRKRFATK